MMIEKKKNVLFSDTDLFSLTGLYTANDQVQKRIASMMIVLYTVHMLHENIFEKAFRL